MKDKDKERERERREWSVEGLVRIRRKAKFRFYPALMLWPMVLPRMLPHARKACDASCMPLLFFFFFIARAPTMTMTPDRVRAGRRVWSKCGDYLLDGFTLPRNHLSPEP